MLSRLTGVSHVSNNIVLFSFMTASTRKVAGHKGAEGRGESGGSDSVRSSGMQYKSPLLLTYKCRRAEYRMMGREHDVDERAGGTGTDGTTSWILDRCISEQFCTNKYFIIYTVRILDDEMDYSNMNKVCRNVQY